MPLFVFDVNEGDSSEWEDEDLECDTRSEIEEHALLLLEEASTRMAARGAQSLPSTVVVFEQNGQIIMSMHGWHKEAVRVRWLSNCGLGDQTGKPRPPITLTTYGQWGSRAEPPIEQ